MSELGPTELAALVAREADDGVAEALGALDAAGVLVVDQVIARVAHVPDRPGPEPDLSEVIWQAEVVLHPSDRANRGEVDAHPEVSQRLGALPVRAVRGVGQSWEARLRKLGVSTVAEFAALPPSAILNLCRQYGVEALSLVARARAVGDAWPPSPKEAQRWGSVLAVASGDPETVGFALWSRCLALTGVLDASVLEAIELVV